MKNYNLCRVSDIRIIEARGPWSTKSGGELAVSFSLSQNDTKAFLDFDNPEFELVRKASNVDIRGLRSYTVSNIGRDAIGAQEWHKARTEYVRAVAGTALWQCIDIMGNTEEYVLDQNLSVIIPPGIFHTYTALDEDTSLQVFCNTLFIPEDSRTHDTYNRDMFNELSATNLTQNNL